MKMNKAQQTSLKRVWTRNNQGKSYLAFRRTVCAGCNCAMVHWSGMWLGIEPDGYTHS